MIKCLQRVWQCMIAFSFSRNHVSNETEMTLIFVKTTIYFLQYTLSGVSIRIIPTLVMSIEDS